MRSGTGLCRRCFNLTLASEEMCGVCADPERQASLVCVVEEPLDVLAIERTGQFRGRFHVLHGAISPVEGVGPDDLRIAELAARVRTEGIEELILATNPTIEGETTALYIRQTLQAAPLRMTRLARGLPSGGDLEYADITTLSQALEGRREL
jgi:recombination protein RecR